MMSVGANSFQRNVAPSSRMGHLPQWSCPEHIEINKEKTFKWSLRSLTMHTYYQLGLQRKTLTVTFSSTLISMVY